MPLAKADLARLRSLQEKKHREALGLFVVEGNKVVSELLAANFPFVEMYEVERGLRTRSEPVEPVRPGLSDGERPGSTKVTFVTSAEMARLSHYPTPSTVLAVGKINRPVLAVGAINHGLTLALDGIQDPGNVGTLLRIADWFAFDRVLLSPDCADLFSQKVINASMGSFARVTCHTTPLTEALAGVTAPVLGCDLNGDDAHTLQPLRNAIIVIGSEGRGISEAVRSFVTYYITIPRYGGAESLNAAVAAAIVCDNLRRAAKKQDRSSDGAQR